MLSPSPYALPVEQLILAIRADPRWHDRAAAVEEGWLFEPPRSSRPPCPVAVGARADDLRHVGDYGRWAEARRKKRKAAEMAQRTLAEAKEAGEASEPINEPSGENAPEEPYAIVLGKSEGCGPSASLRFPQKTNQKRRLRGRAHLRAVA